MQQVEYGQPDLWTVLTDEDTARGLPAGVVPPASEAAAGHPGTAAFLARECVRVDTLTEWELEDLQARCDARGVRQWDALARGTLKRSVQDAQSLDELCKWIRLSNLDILATFTFTDETARKRGVHTLQRAIRDVCGSLKRVNLGSQYKPGFQNRFVLAGEWHPSGRSIPHVHGLFESGGIDSQRLCQRLFEYFHHSTGRCRFEPMRDVNEATLYGLKDTLKLANDTGAVFYRLQRPRCNRNRGAA